MNPEDVSAISEIADMESIRVVLYRNGRLVHTPLLSLLKDMQFRIEELESRVTELENNNG
jgi:hypothetical protein